VVVNGDGTTAGLDAEWKPEVVERAKSVFWELGAPNVVLPGWMALDRDLPDHVFRALAVMSTVAAGDRLLVSQAELARRLGVTHQAMAKTMTQAQQRGLLERCGGRGPAATWRLTWLSKQQPPVAEQQPQQQPPVAEQQPQAAVLAHARGVNPRTSTSKSSSGRSVVKPVLTDEERAWLHARYDNELGSTFVDEQIEAALGYKSAKNYTHWKIYCSNWLQGAVEKVYKIRAAKAGNEAANVRLERAKAPYQAPANPHEPKLQRHSLPTTPLQNALARWKHENPDRWPDDPTTDELRPYLEAMGLAS
jgi:hypothetical protein